MGLQEEEHLIGLAFRPNTECEFDELLCISDVSADGWYN